MSLKKTYSIAIFDWQEAQGLIGDIRRTVFIDEQGVPPELEWDGLDDGARHAIARDSDSNNNKIVVGYGRLLPTQQIGRMAVLPAYRRQGIGTAILCSLEAEARRLSYPSVFLHAQVQALPFYLRYDYHMQDDIFFEADIPHRRCEKALSGTIP